MGVMSPTKLRMKLLGMGSHGHGHGNKDEPAASKSLPSRLVAADDDHPRNSLLAQELDSSSSRSRSSGPQVCCSLWQCHRRRRQLRVPHGGVEGRGRGRPRALLPPGALQVERRGEVDCREERRALQPHLLQEGRCCARTQRSRRRGGVRVVPESAAPPSDAKKASGGNALTEPRQSSSPSPSSSSLSSVTGPTSKPPPRAKLRVPVGAPATVAQSSVSMRDIGTEMAPVASQEQSRSGTPAGAATPSLSPLCSVSASPSTSERELQLRTRREIAALGLQLGKMSIASWASKEDRVIGFSPENIRNILFSPDNSTGAGDEDEAKKEEFAARAAAWAESKKCKLASSYHRKEVKIQEWEDCQKSKFEAKMRHAEVQADQMKARAKNSLTKRRLDESLDGSIVQSDSRKFSTLLLIHDI